MTLAWGGGTLTEFHALHTASDAAGSLEHSDIREALLQKRFGCSQASQAGANHHHARLSPSPQATTERVIRTVAPGFTTLHTVRTGLLGTCRGWGCHSLPALPPLPTCPMGHSSALPSTGRGVGTSSLPARPETRGAISKGHGRKEDRQKEGAR